MPQTFVYLIGFLISSGIRLLYAPSLNRLLSIVNFVCLAGVVIFGILETYQDIRLSRAHKRSLSASAHTSDSEALPR
ncbi:hypothetical protein GS501_02670 [Saccharibacter sp. 17.LH.SD]|uniref:hypothetical protein n=1 Tax=Saccharibacter sp. 17.LH.SD TaxID=2689393 RepID=UPI00136FFF18|nr:hypothetical protein [Saccharibacter sp. 17.LH.SD]MXV43957.1 hypothetical protein [Saccharibacter sp. 17.LH.SD]